MALRIAASAGVVGEVAEDAVLAEEEDDDSAAAPVFWRLVSDCEVMEERMRFISAPPLCDFRPAAIRSLLPVSYTHLTLPTICSV